jgi:hypothetical protein
MQLHGLTLQQHEFLIAGERGRRHAGDAACSEGYSIQAVQVNAGRCVRRMLCLILARNSMKQQQRVGITCKRGSAKDSVKDEHADTYDLSGTCQTETPQPINMKFARELIREGAYLMCQKWLELFGWGRSSQMGEYTFKTFIFTLPYLTLPYLIFLL